MPESISSNAASEPEAVKNEPFARVTRGQNLALGQARANGAARAVLVAILTYSHHGAWRVGIPRLMADTALSRRAVQGAIRWLMTHGFVERKRRHGREVFAYCVLHPIAAIAQTGTPRAHEQVLQGRTGLHPEGARSCAPRAHKQVLQGRTIVRPKRTVIERQLSETTTTESFDDREAVAEARSVALVVVDGLSATRTPKPTADSRLARTARSLPETRAMLATLGIHGRSVDSILDGFATTDDLTLRSAVYGIVGRYGFDSEQDPSGDPRLNTVFVRSGAMGFAAKIAAATNPQGMAVATLRAHAEGIRSNYAEIAERYADWQGRGSPSLAQAAQRASEARRASEAAQAAQEATAAAERAEAAQRQQEAKERQLAEAEREAVAAREARAAEAHRVRAFVAGLSPEDRAELEDRRADRLASELNAKFARTYGAVDWRSKVAAEIEANPAMRKVAIAGTYGRFDRELGTMLASPLNKCPVWRDLIEEAAAPLPESVAGIARTA